MHLILFVLKRRMVRSKLMRRFLIRKMEEVLMKSIIPFVMVE